jgi:hypothetical protein
MESLKAAEIPSALKALNPDTEVTDEAQTVAEMLDCG